MIHPVWLKPWHVDVMIATYSFFAIDWFVTVFNGPSSAMWVRTNVSEKRYQNAIEKFNDKNKTDKC